MTNSLRRLPLALVAVAALLAAPAVDASTISETETFAIPPIPNANANFFVLGGTFHNFDTSLGTLTGVSLAFSGSARVSLVFTDSSTQDLLVLGNVGDGPGGSLGFGGFATTLISAGLNDFDFSIFGTGTSPHSLAFFSRPGSTELDPDLDTAALGASAGSAVLSSLGGISETLTFTFTPAVAPGAVPEPAPIALFGIGVAGLVAARRRRKP